MLDSDADCSSDDAIVSSACPAVSSTGRAAVKPAGLVQVQGMTGSKLYGAKSGADYTDNQWRFKLLSQAALEALTCLPFSPGEEAAVVCNDWHTALLPVLLKVAAVQSC